MIRARKEKPEPAGAAARGGPADIPFRAGNPLKKSSLDSAWQRLVDSAIQKKIISESDYFTLHGLKHRGITDSADKGSGGHKTLSQQQRYDHELPEYDPAPELSGELSGAGKIDGASN